METGVPSSTLTEKGSSTINCASNARKDSIHAMPGDKIHRECRRKYCNPHQIAKDAEKEDSVQTLVAAYLYLGHLRMSFLSRLISSSVVDQPSLGGKESMMFFKSKLLD